MSPHLTTLALGFYVLLLTTPVAANHPTNITYKTKGNGEMEVYSVSCADGSKRTISAWNGRKNWCIGTTTRHCTNDQLETAKKACLSSGDA
ncbi:hypothetical protein [Thioflexithrix psekupsensis]|uniref:Uncharacterized protein n=1 Tax=Thioflexithrix psekupsensis TaxID=1570016 RepID=A0A251XBN1_9GAMM|nr:hypothetical protein [Thioflexithrix psekupsensis]OUD15476.1 hypothetical protein TPSD3_02820 [Thioflexithrix psekupsensis]